MPAPRSQRVNRGANSEPRARTVAASVSLPGSTKIPLVCTVSLFPLPYFCDASGRPVPCRATRPATASPNRRPARSTSRRQGHPSAAWRARARWSIKTYAAFGDVWTSGARFAVPVSVPAAAAQCVFVGRICGTFLSQTMRISGNPSSKCVGTTRFYWR